jgi:hypothetical protein
MDDWNEQQKAAHAKALLDDPMIEDFFVQTRQQLFEAWCNERDITLRETLWERAQALDNFRAYLHGYIAAGTLLTHAEQINE